MGEALRAAIAQHGGITRISTGIIAVRRDGVIFHTVMSRVWHTDNESTDLAWQEFLDPEAAALHARTRSKQIRKLVRPPR